MLYRNTKLYVSNIDYIFHVVSYLLTGESYYVLDLLIIVVRFTSLLVNIVGAADDGAGRDGGYGGPGGGGFR